MKDAGVTTWLFLSWSDPGTPLMSPSVGICKKPTFFLYVKWFISGFYGPVRSFKPVSWLLLVRGSQPLFRSWLRFSETLARRKRVGRVWTSTCRGGGWPSGHGAGSPGQAWPQTAMEQHHWYRYRCEPGFTECIWAACLTLCLQLAGRLWSGIAVSGRESSYEHSYFEVQVKETPIFSAVADLLVLNRC